MKRAEEFFRSRNLRNYLSRLFMRIFILELVRHLFRERAFPKLIFGAEELPVKCRSGSVQGAARASRLDVDHNCRRAASLSSRDLQRARSASDMSGLVSSCWKKSKIRLIRAARSTACCRFRRCVLVRVRMEFAKRLADSASEARIATRLSRSILTSEFRRASRSRMMFACSHASTVDFDLPPLYSLASIKYHWRAVAPAVPMG
jgi:hypothetical protein